MPGQRNNHDRGSLSSVPAEYRVVGQSIGSRSEFKLLSDKESRRGVGESNLREDSGKSYEGRSGISGYVAP